MVRNVAMRKRADLVVIGRGCIQNGRGRLRANAYAIIREAPCPVLSV
jgi:nucleotide-binding universal stress UspA family protein